MFLCFGMNTFTRDELGDGEAPLDLYDPRHPDVGQWMRVEELATVYQSCLENRVNLLLSVPPNQEGIIPDQWIRPLQELKKRVRR